MYNNLGNLLKLIREIYTWVKLKGKCTLLLPPTISVLALTFDQTMKPQLLTIFLCPNYHQ
jgi:hypothetical protein